MTTHRTSASYRARTRRPTAAERARSVACSGSATLCAAGVGQAPLLAQATTASGEMVVVVPSDGDLVTAVDGSPQGDVPVLLTLTDRAPVPLREPTRAQLWIFGWLSSVPAVDQAATLQAFADVSPAGVLLDVGRTASLLRLDYADLVLGESGLTEEVGPERYAAASPDPLVAVEADAVRHLEQDHPRELAILRSRLPADCVGPGDVVRPLGLDRWGLRLRIERLRGSRDFRLPFARPVSCAAELGEAMRRLLCAAPGS